MALEAPLLNGLKVTDRKQCVRIGDTHSSPLLFLIYINDIVESSNILQFTLFADDTCIFYSS